jgi:hypothetical protein
MRPTARTFLWDSANDAALQLLLAGLLGGLGRDAVRCVRFTEGWKYQIDGDFSVLLPELADPARPPIRTKWIELDPDGTLRLKDGYASDGPTDPAIDTPSFMRGAFAHDGLYALIRMGLLPQSARPIADKILRRLCREDGMFSVRAWWVHLGVKYGGGPSADPASTAPIRCAPGGCPDCPRKP